MQRFHSIVHDFRGIRSREILQLDTSIIRHYEYETYIQTASTSNPLKLYGRQTLLQIQVVNSVEFSIVIQVL